MVNQTWDATEGDDGYMLMAERQKENLKDKEVRRDMIIHITQFFKPWCSMMTMVMFRKASILLLSTKKKKK